jgi:hypothetical protein
MYLECSRNQQSVYKASLPSCSDSSSSNSSWLTLAFLLSSAWPLTPQPQPNLYLQLSQILEWEIWNHSQTRSGLCSELTRRMELETQVWKLNQNLAQWQESCNIAYAALDEHRAENANLKLDVEALTDELRHLRQIQVRHSDPLAPADMAIGRGKSRVLNLTSRTGRGCSNRRKRYATQRSIASD